MGRKCDTRGQSRDSDNFEAASGCDGPVGSLLPEGDTHSSQSRIWLSFGVRCTDASINRWSCQPCRQEQSMLRAAIVGLGKMGLSHHSILNAHPEVPLKAVCD